MCDCGKKFCYVVSDMEGMVGVFTEYAAAADSVKKYSELGARFVIMKYPIDVTASTDLFYPVIYYNSNAIAFISNNIKEAQAAQKILAEAGIAEDDDLQYWETPSNRITDSAQRRLDDFYTSDKDPKILAKHLELIIGRKLECMSSDVHEDFADVLIAPYIIDSKKECAESHKEATEKVESD